MNVGQIIETEISSSGMNGEGVARVDGKVVFIPYTLKGERVKAVVKSVKSKYAAASVIKVLSPSEHRIAPKCPHFYKCGGCDMGHVSQSYRRETLIAELASNLKKIAGIDLSPSEFVAAPPRSASRNKLAMPFGIVDGKIVLGLYRQNTHIVEPVRCLFASERMQNVAQAVCRFADAERLSVYNESTGNGLLRHLVIREIGERMSVTVVVNSDVRQEWENKLAARLPEYADFFVCPNTRRNNVIMGDEVRLVKGNARLAADVLGVRAELSPLAFFQVNDFIRDRLYESALSHISGETLVDLYSGIGITSNLAAKKCKRVFAVECVPQAVTDADRTAELNGNADRIENICGDVQKVLPRLAERCVGADVLVDPPRKGCGSDVMTAIADFGPNKLIYISCNHATMCRDIKVFLDAAPYYEPTDCRLFDMFPDTHHVETLICLERKKS